MTPKQARQSRDKLEEAEQQRFSNPVLGERVDDQPIQADIEWAAWKWSHRGE